MGVTYRVLQGEGEFAGADAYREFERLAAVFQEEGPGLLVHPVWRTERAYFLSLSVTEEPRPDYVRYRFMFWEDMGGCDGSLTERSGTGAVLLPVERRLRRDVHREAGRYAVGHCQAVRCEPHGADRRQSADQKSQSHLSGK